MAQDKHTPQTGDKKPADQAELDEALEETFPASDPPAVTQGTTGIPRDLDKARREVTKPTEKPSR